QQLQLSGTACVARPHTRDRAGGNAGRPAPGKTRGARPLEQPRAGRVGRRSGTALRKLKNIWSSRSNRSSCSSACAPRASEVRRLERSAAVERSEAIERLERVL